MRLAALAVGLVACGTPPVAPGQAPPPFVADWLDRSTSPCDSLYQFACGGWLKTARIPADKALWDTSFAADYDRGQTLIEQILDDAARGSGDAKLGDFWASCLDARSAEDSARTVFARRFAQIDALSTPAELARLVAQMHLEIYNSHDAPLFTFNRAHDYGDATQTIGEADQAGFSFDRDYYVKTEPDRVRTMADYRGYIASVFVALGESSARAEADATADFEIEAALASAALDRSQRRDPQQRVHRLDRAGLRALAPAFDWDAYFTALGTPDVQAINVVPPDELGKLDSLVRPANFAKLKPYLKWFSVAPYVWLTSGPLFAVRHAFRTKVAGIEAEEPRWRACIEAATQIMPDAIAKAYVARAFSPEAKTRALDMVERIERAFDANLATLAWMDEPTKAAARDKLAMVVNQIGYPAKWRDYGDLAIDRRAMLPSYLAGVTASSKHELAKIGHPDDRNEMTSPAMAVDASYDASLDEMTFPAGIMQPPFFTANAPAAANFGGIGFVVGHELTHGFDDQGRQFDGRGNLRDWWTPASSAAYTRKAACVVGQYSGYIAIGDIHLDGKATLGENIADNGGLKLAHAAWLAQRSTSEPAYDGYSDEQQFFIAFAQSWCTVMRPQMAAWAARSDEHALRRWRVDGPAANLPAFSQAFGCTAGAPLAPATRCEVW